MDAYDRFWQWAKPPESLLTIPTELHHAVMTLRPDDQCRCGAGSRTER
jgi:hypothetical protein